MTISKINSNPDFQWRLLGWYRFLDGTSDFKLHISCIELIFRNCTVVKSFTQQLQHEAGKNQPRFGFHYHSISIRMITAKCFLEARETKHSNKISTTHLQVISQNLSFPLSKFGESKLDALRRYQVENKQLVAQWKL